MGKLSELARRDYNLEAKVIEDAGNRLWAVGIGIAIVLAIMCGFDYFFGRAWDRLDFSLALATVVIGPFVNRAWERHSVATRMRHEREIRVELKVDALLGLVNIEDEN
ncbi:MAG: hypothetical protein WBY53_18845 [Acidobacteriaceae bacterium]